MHVFYVGTQVHTPVHVEARGLRGCVHIYMEVFLHCVYWETRSLTKLEFAVWLGQWDLLVSMSSALGLYSTTLSCQAFMGISTWSPCFQGSHLTDGVVSPVHLLHHL